LKQNSTGPVNTGATRKVTFRVIQKGRISRCGRGERVTKAMSERRLGVRDTKGGVEEKWKKKRKKGSSWDAQAEK